MPLASPLPQIDPTLLKTTGGIGGALTEGSVCANGVAMVAVVNTAGLQRGRLRFKATAAGTVSFRWLRTDGATPYTHAGSKPADLTIVASTENVFDLTTHYGEPFLEVTFTPSGAGVITWADICRVLA